MFLKDCDLVKFANVTPTEEDCRKALDAGERIVRVSMPQGGHATFAEGSGI